MIKMDFQSAMETFAEAWVAANTGKLGLSSSVSGLVGTGSTLDLNKAAESIIQHQLGKGAGGIGGVVGGSSIYSQLQQQQACENGGLDYPKIHSSSSLGNITPASSTPSSTATAGGGMDLSPQSKRIKGFSPSSVGSSCTIIPGSTTGTFTHAALANSSLGMPRNNKHISMHPNPGHHNLTNHLQEFDPSHLLGGHHPSAASAVLVESVTGQQPKITLQETPAATTAKKRGTFNAPVAVKSQESLKSGENKTVGKKSEPKSVPVKRKSSTSPVKLAERKPRKSPVLRTSTDKDVADQVMCDILDTIDGSNGNAPEVVENLMEEMMAQYEKKSADRNETEGKSLPIHCVIEVSDITTTTGSTNSGSRGDRDPGKVEMGGNSSGSNSNTKGTLGGSNSSNGSAGVTNGVKTVEVDDFVIIPAGTPFHDVVATVLTLLGYPKDAMQQAEGSILLRNWKPLKLDQICDSAHKTVGDIFNDLTNHATLRVLVKRPKGGTAEDLKEKLLRLLLAQSSNILMGSGCPLDESTLGQLVKGQWPQNLAEDVKKRFDQWYSAHQQKLAATLEQQHSTLGRSTIATNQIGASNGNNGSNAGGLSVVSPHQHPHLVNGSSGLSSTVSRHHLLEKSFDDDAHTNHPVFHGLATQKTRMRTSFDPEMELPRLQQWFAENPHPSRHQIQQYVRELNNLDCRKDRKPLDLNNVIYWFKNARAAQKRNELRYNGYSPSQAFSHHQLHSQTPSSNPHHHHHHHHLSGLTGDQLEDRLRDRNGDEHDREDRDYMNDNSESSYRDSDSDMKEYREDKEEIGAEKDDNRDREEDPTSTKDENGPSSEDRDMKVIVKEEQDDDFISVDVELTDTSVGNVNPPNSGESCSNNNEPRDLSGKSQSSRDGDRDEKREGDDPPKLKEDRKEISDSGNPSESLGEMRSRSTSPSVSPRSSPGMSPNHPYDFSGAHSMVSRFHPFFDHPFMAYRHLNSFNLGQHFPSGPDGPNPSAYESALSMVGRKGVLPSGKPSPGIELFRDFPNGLPMVPSRGAGGGPMISTGGSDHLSRLRGEEFFTSRSASSAEIISSIINSNRSDLGLSPLNLGSHHSNPNAMALDERRKRNRTFIDPVTEVPRLEQWFILNTHPSHNLILKYTEELNRMPYRQKFPKLEPKNVQFWFKNRRAKCKRLKMTL